MEFPNLGEKCSICDVHDFVPWLCNYCNKKHCNEHRLSIHHNCNKLPLKEVIVEKKELKKKEWCNVRGCREKNPLLVDCDKCKKKHCISHRFEKCKTVSVVEEEKKREGERVRYSLVEVIFENDTQFLPLLSSQANDFDSLKRRVSSLFKTSDFTLKWIDEENDFISIKNKRDLSQAWESLKKNSNFKHLSLFLSPNSSPSSSCKKQASQQNNLSQPSHNQILSK